MNDSNKFKVAKKMSSGLLSLVILINSTMASAGGKTVKKRNVFQTDDIFDETYSESDFGELYFVDGNDNIIAEVNCEYLPVLINNEMLQSLEEQVTDQVKNIEMKVDGKVVSFSQLKKMIDPKNPNEILERITLDGSPLEIRTLDQLINFRFIEDGLPAPIKTGGLPRPSIEPYAIGPIATAVVSSVASAVASTIVSKIIDNKSSQDALRDIMKEGWLKNPMLESKDGVLIMKKGYVKALLSQEIIDTRCLPSSIHTSDLIKTIELNPHLNQLEKSDLIGKIESKNTVIKFLKKGEITKPILLPPRNPYINTKFDHFLSGGMPGKYF